MQGLGYKIKPLNGYEFSSQVLFKDYVEHFYALKKEATGPARFLAKLMLNNLYGLFGKSLNPFQARITNDEEINNYVALKKVHSRYKVSKDLSLLLVGGP